MPIKLSEVFGVSTEIPQYTYVDRQQLDKRFSHYLESQKHVVVYGASKQGKSCLRRKNTKTENSVVVQCLPDMESAQDVWKSALEKMGMEMHVKTVNKNSSAEKIAGSASGGVNGIIAKADLRIEGGSERYEGKETETNPVSSGKYLDILARSLRENDRRLILEDFHYLPEHARKEVVFGIKALYEEGAYVVIIGVWSEQNLITYYNGDLTGRIEEVNLTWSDEELDEVLRKGEGALNVEFAAGLRSQLLESAFQNVGLLQRLAEKVCVEAEIYESQSEKVILSDISFLTKARNKIVSDVRQRYNRIAGVFKEGLRANSLLHLYGRVYNELIDASDKELIEGIPTSELLARIGSRSNHEIRASDLTQALDRIERLQAKSSITPLLVSYSKSVKKLFLNDREFIFYRKYSGDDTDELKVEFE